MFIRSLMTLLLMLAFGSCAVNPSAPPEYDGNYTTHWGKRKPPINPRVAKEYIINLDLPVNEAFKDIARDFKKPMDKFLKTVLFKYIPFKLLDWFTYARAKKYNKEYADEIRDISELFKIPFSDTFILNFMYELAAACSAIVVQDANDKVLMGRTLDFGMSQVISDLAFHAKYYKDGKLFYESIDLAGFRGLVSAMRENTFSFAINEYFFDKDEADSIPKLILTYIRKMKDGNLPAPYVGRKAFEQANDYDDLVGMLVSVNTISRAHYTVSGAKKGQGAVITKYQDALEALDSLDVEKGIWYVVQTNYQRSKPDPPLDNRRTAATDRLNNITRQDINIENFHEKVMNLYPTFNAHTIHTTMYDVSTGYFNTTMWY